MSGGHFSYVNNQLEEVMFGCSHNEKRSIDDCPCPDPLEDEELSELAFDLLNVIKTCDYAFCADWSHERYFKEKDNFKKKWIRGSEEERKVIKSKSSVDRKIESIKKELYELYGIHAT